jgi:hypothetical protein
MRPTARAQTKSRLLSRRGAMTSVFRNRGLTTRRPPIAGYFEEHEPPQPLLPPEPQLPEEQPPDPQPRTPLAPQLDLRAGAVERSLSEKT